MTIMPSEPIGPFRLATVCANAFSFTLPKTVGLVNASTITNKLPAPEYIVNGIWGMKIKHNTIVTRALSVEASTILPSNILYICIVFNQTTIKMKTILSLICICVVVLTLSSCYTLNLKSTPNEHPISLSNMPKGKIIKHFTYSKTVGHLILGLITLDDVDVAKTISDEVEAAGGTEAINVKITYQMTFVNGLVNLITLNIYNPLTLDIEGDIAN